MSAIDDAFDFLNMSILAIQDGDREGAIAFLETAMRAYAGVEGCPESDRRIYEVYREAIVRMVNEVVEPEQVQH